MHTGKQPQSHAHPVHAHLCFPRMLQHPQSVSDGYKSQAKALKGVLEPLQLNLTLRNASGSPVASCCRCFFLIQVELSQTADAVTASRRLAYLPKEVVDELASAGRWFLQVTQLRLSGKEMHKRSVYRKVCEVCNFNTGDEHFSCFRWRNGYGFVWSPSRSTALFSLYW